MANERIEDDSVGRRGSPAVHDSALEALAELTRRLLACRAVAIAVNGGGATVFDPSAYLPGDLPRDPAALADPLTAEDFGLGFYAGVPVIVRGGDLGTLAAVDTVPRELGKAELGTLKLAAQVAAALIEAGKANRG